MHLKWFRKCGFSTKCFRLYQIETKKHADIRPILRQIKNNEYQSLLKLKTFFPVVRHGLVAPGVGVSGEVGESVDGHVDLGHRRGVVDVAHCPQE